MKEQLNPTIDPSRIGTELLFGIGSSVVCSLRLVSIAPTMEEQAQRYLLLGSLGQMGRHIGFEGRTDVVRPTTVGTLVQLRTYREPFYEGIEDFFRRDLNSIGDIVEEGDQLIAGPFALETEPGEKSEVIPGVEGVWAPLELVLGKGLIATEEQKQTTEPQRMVPSQRPPFSDDQIRQLVWKSRRAALHARDELDVAEGSFDTHDPSSRVRLVGSAITLSIQIGFLGGLILGSRYQDLELEDGLKRVLGIDIAEQERLMQEWLKQQQGEF